MVVTGSGTQERRSPPSSPKAADATARPMVEGEDDIVARVGKGKAKEVSQEQDRLNHLKGYAVTISAFFGFQLFSWFFYCLWFLVGYRLLYVKLYEGLLFPKVFESDAAWWMTKYEL